MKNPATGTMVAGQMATPTGLESADISATSGSILSTHALGAVRTERTGASDLPDPSGLPSAVPSFLEACAKLAGRAAAEGDFERAKVLIQKAASVAQSAEQSMRLTWPVG